MMPRHQVTMLLVLLWASACTHNAPFSQPNEVILKYEAARKPSCLTKPNAPPPSAARAEGIRKAQLALAEGRDSLNSPFWDYVSLSSPRDMTIMLRLFALNKRGTKLKFVNLQSKDAEAIHRELLAHGFYHKRLPLRRDSDAEPPVYWRRDGTTTTNGLDRDVVPLDLYTHADGSLIKIKAEGVPDPQATAPRRQPHISLAVLQDTDPHCDDHNRCELDTSYDNEAFKVSLAGLAIPKSPAPGYGFRYLYPPAQVSSATQREENAGWTDTIMGAAHTDLPADYSHCAKAAGQ